MPEAFFIYLYYFIVDNFIFLWYNSHDRGGIRAKDYRYAGKEETY